MRATTGPIPGTAHLPSDAELEDLFLRKHGGHERMGPGPRRRFASRYFLPADVYEATVEKHVFPGCSWLDVGGGHALFPDNEGLARALAARAGRVVAVDPSPNVLRNPFAQDRVNAFLEDYSSDAPFDLATMRMVVEHVERPSAFVGSLSRLVRPGGLAIVFTVNLWAPVTLVSRLVPFGLHHAVKSLFWGGEEKDTFPAHYRMNTRMTLRRLFAEGGFAEAAFAKLGDLSVFGKFGFLNRVELALWRAARLAGVQYPENCLLGLYAKR
ncbi:MAG: class I SAM-dependent methyltransferase [Gemmataceae bacterium]|nr:class I SAM-dependent methyltransferase [Gemmataceae bacterium]